MQIDAVRWIGTVALLAVVIATGCRHMTSARRDSPDELFGVQPELPPDEAGAHPVRAVAYDERLDFGASRVRENGARGTDNLSLASIERTFNTWTGRGPDQQEAMRLYGEGEGLFQQAQAAAPAERRALFDAAAAKYADAAKKWPDSALEENALMMVGESRYFADRYPKAEDGYGLLIKKYPNTTHMDTVASRRFALAKWWLAQHQESPRATLQPNFIDEQLPRFDTFGNAARLYDRIRLDDPTGKLADDATMAAAGAYFQAGKYRQADRFYADLRKSFPNSPHQFRAHLLGVMCKLKIYQGPDYNGKPLEQAEELIERIYRQFPHEVSQEQEHLQKAFAEVQALRAQRLHYYSRYYERRGEYGGARYYYAQIVEQFPNSSLADMARERINAIADRPNRPPQRMQWLVNLFPEPKPRDAFIRAGDENPVTRFLYDPLSVARGTSFEDGTNSHLR